MVEAVIEELIEFTGLPEAEVRARVGTQVLGTAESYEARPGDDVTWYRDTDAYLFELANWEGCEFRDALATKMGEGLAGVRLPVLEYGFGIGSFVLRLVDEGLCVVACDANARNTDFLRFRVERRGLGNKVAVVSPDEALVEKEGYGMISCQHVLEHVEDPHGLLRSFHECLVPSGWFLGVAPFDLIGPIFPEHKPEYAHLRLEDLCAEAGFVDVGTSYFGGFDGHPPLLLCGR